MVAHPKHYSQIFFKHGQLTHALVALWDIFNWPGGFGLQIVCEVFFSSQYRFYRKSWAGTIEEFNFSLWNILCFMSIAFSTITFITLSFLEDTAGKKEAIMGTVWKKYPISQIIIISIGKLCLF